ncbi:Importin subunit alpha-8 [Symbiodinium microadriaticum]|uniref:Importin subunit alpha-8 n=1 Tax=Symbiodinium microadriaticum TaxID=2951 RepID=A0A1Q9DIE4_SYMMI|nr:Importin subunit alpha-8 [Symbiodinium microadriaticum]
MDTVKRLQPSVRELSSKDPTARSDAAKDLAVIVKEHHLYPISLVQLDGLKPLIKLVSAKEKDAQGGMERANAALALGHFAKSSNKHREAVVAAGGLGPLVRMLDSDRSVERCQASFAVAQLCEDDARAQSIAVRLNAVHHLVRELSLESGAVSNAAYALAVLCGKMQVQSEIGRIGAAEPLVQHLSAPNAAERIDAAHCLSKLAKGNAENQARILEAGVLEPLMVLLSSSLSGEKHNAAMALSSICDGYEPAQTAFAEAGALEVMIQALPKQSAEQRQAIVALGAMARGNVDTAAAIVEAGCMDILLQQLRSCASAERAEAAVTLANLAEMNEEAEDALKKPGAFVAVKRELGLL